MNLNISFRLIRYSHDNYRKGSVRPEPFKRTRSDESEPDSRTIKPSTIMKTNIDHERNFLIVPPDLYLVLFDRYPIQSPFLEDIHDSLHKRIVIDPNRLLYNCHEKII